MLQTPESFSNYNSRTVPKHWNWIHIFVLFQFILQILLLFPQFGVMRAPMRTATFLLSLVSLVVIQREGVKHPAKIPAILVFVILGLSWFFHPFLNSPLSGFAQIAMYLAILGPLFWVSRLNVTPKGFEWLIYILWGFHTISAVFGVLQVNYPGRFQPYLSTAIQNSKYGGENLMITLASGEKVYRPMGLTDRPGGAAWAGFYALLLGVGIALYTPNKYLKVVGFGSAAIGLFCIYLSQVRSILVFAVVALICFATVLARTGQIARLTTMGITVVTLFMGTFSWAVAVGGESTLDRISSLWADSPTEVYAENRGGFLQHTIENLLPQYPLGAGLGRWGMMNGYFGQDYNPFTKSIWVEIQWTGWLLDGGVPLIIAYVAALFFTFYTAWKIAMTPELGDFRLWGGLIFAYDIGALAITFNYPLFISQGGMEFWLLNTALFVAAYNQWRQQQELNEDYP